MSKQVTQRHPDSNKSEQDDSAQSINQTSPTTFLLNGHEESRDNANNNNNNDNENDGFSRSPTPPLPGAINTDLASELSDNMIPVSDTDYPVSNHSATSSISLDPHRKADLLARTMGEDRWRMENTCEYPNSNSSNGDNEHQRRSLPPRPCAPPPLSQAETEIMMTSRHGLNNHNHTNVVSSHDATPSSSFNATATVLDPARKRYPKDFIMGRHIGEGSYSTVSLYNW
jgi:hypothetical protein